MSEEQKFNMMIQEINNIILKYECTVGQYFAMLHTMTTKALSENPKGIEKAFISNLKREILKLRLAKIREKQNV